MKCFALLVVSIIVGCTHQPLGEIASVRSIASIKPRISVGSYCEKSNWDGNFNLVINEKLSEPNWYSSGIKQHTINFTNINDCEEQGAKVINGISKVTYLCGCAASIHLGMAMGPGESWYYQNINCLRLDPTKSAEKIISTKYVVRGNWDSLTVKQRESAKISEYFDSNREGENYKFCRDKVLPEITKKIEVQ